MSLNKKFIMCTPSYRKLLESGELKKRILEAEAHLVECKLCGWHCKLNRISGQFGNCCSGVEAIINGSFSHMGEETPLSGTKGSGTIFFSGCNLHCQFCQNHEISQGRRGIRVSPEELAQEMLHLQAHGCHNINLVSPTHYMVPILKAISLAAEKGLVLPIVYNTGGYDSFECLRILNDVVDIYMPDMKFSDETMARKYSRIPDYPSINQTAVLEMHRQVGDLLLDSEGVAFRGIIIRHLVLPDDISGSETIIKFIAENISKNTYLNIMDQYYPAYLAIMDLHLNRRITIDEYQHVVKLAKFYGLNRLSA